MSSAASKIIVVGGGPGAMFLLQALAELPSSEARFVASLEISVFERRARFGVGTPYSEEHSLPIHTLAGNQEVRRLDKGAQIERDFHDAVVRLRERGGSVRLAPATEIVDVEHTADGFVVRASDGTTSEARWVVLATGIWPHGSRRAGLLMPWPAKTLTCAIEAGDRVGVLGAALTAVDAVIAIATAFGAFERRGRQLVYRPTGAAPRFSLFSRGGYLPTVAGWGVTSARGDPEAAAKYDRHFTARAVDALEAAGGVRLSSVWDLLRADLLAAGIAASEDVPASFEAACASLSARFADGRGLARFARDCRGAIASVEARRMRPLQALIWQKNELLRRCYAQYPGDDRVLYDRYATLLLAFQQPVNLASAEHLLALARAGRLSIDRVGASYELAAEAVGWRLRSPALGIDRHVDKLVDARGEGRDIETADGLLGRLACKSFLRPALVPFVATPSPESAASDGRTVLLRDRHYYRAGGLAIDPATCEARLETSGRDRRKSVFAIGPLAQGYYPFSDGLHAISEMAPKIIAEIVRRVRGARR